MEQLKCRTYSRQEIAEILSVNIKDSNHFKRNVESKLKKWGYEYIYERNGVTITKQPFDPEARLKEILIRELGLDVQINAYDFACFICAFADSPCFDSMPWGERAEMLRCDYGVDVDERTLRNWCSKLFENNIVQKSAERTYWKTEMCGGMKCRSKISADDSGMALYFQERTRYLQEARESAAVLGLRGKEASKYVWSLAYSRLWEKFQCCYYTCGSLVFNAVGEDFVLEIYELAHEIAAKESLPSPIRIKPTTQEEFNETWYNV